MSDPIASAPHLPWRPEQSRAVLRGALVVKLAAGEAPAHIPYRHDVARGKVAAPLSVDGGGRVDRALHAHTPAMRVTRAFAPAERIGGGPTARARGASWSDIEEKTGLSRTLRIEIDPEADVLALLDAVGSLAVVESVSPLYLSVTPFETAGQGHGHGLGNGGGYGVAGGAHHPGGRGLLGPGPGAGPVHPDAGGAGMQRDPWYAHRMIGAAEALAYEPGDTTLILGIVDSGVDLHHPEIEPALRPGYSTVDMPADQAPRSMRLLEESARSGPIPQDMAGHGTACAGIIAARGLRLPHGLAGAAHVVPLRALAAAALVGRTGRTAIGSLLDIDLAVKLGVDLGARVLNLSFGTPESSLRPEDPIPHKDVVEYARAHGCILVAASGNSGTKARYYPACLDGVVAVGSVGPDEQPSHFTTRGDHVDISAPGEQVPSTAMGGGYQLNTGTSFAAPFVAAACALLDARAARYARPLDGDAARELLKQTARPFPREADSKGCGAGILDVPAALRRLESDLNSPNEEPTGWEPPVREPPELARAP